MDFDRGEVGVPAVGSLTVALPEKTITPWLSAFGQRAQRQTANPSRSLDLSASRIPAPDVPTHPTSVAAVPEILRTLTARGYHFVTVSHLRTTL
ncbi:hypothetical protein [Streptomyces sp. NPDC002845]